MTTEQFLKELRAPGNEYSPVPFWFFNDAPDRKKIRAQMEDFVDKGVNAFVLHPRIGIPKDLPYLSEEWFDVVKYIVQTAAELGMHVCLYDEGMYPSGSAHGQVVAANPDWASKGITIRDTPADNTGRGTADWTGETIAELPDGRYLVYEYTHGNIRGIHFGEDDGEAGAPASADILNPEAVACFIHLTHDRYYEHLKEYFGNTIFAFFTDEPSAVGRNAEHYRDWVPGMEKEIVAEGGNLAELAGLFTGTANRTTAVYKKIAKRHLRENFYRQLSEWCASHQIALMGHPAEADDVEEELYFQFPGQDLIQRRIVPESGGISGMESVQSKLASDIARIMGRRRNINECFGVCNRNGWDWYMTAQDMKWYIDWLGMRGVNLYVPHAFFYSVRDTAGERRSGERPPDVGPNNIWWPHYRQFASYFRRLSFLNTDSCNNARVAVLCDNNEVPSDEVKPLYENQIWFNYVPVMLLDKASAGGGRLAMAGYSYEVVLDPFHLLDSDVVAAGIPEGIRAALDRDIPVTTAADEIVVTYGGHLRTVKTAGPEPDLRAVHLTKDGQEMILLSNEGAGRIEEEITLPDSFAGKKAVSIDLWKMPERSEGRQVDDCQIHICLESCQTLLILAGDGRMPENLTSGGLRGKLGANGGRDASESVQPVSVDSIAGIPDWTDRFRLVSREKNRAVYEYRFTWSEADGIRDLHTGEVQEDTAGASSLGNAGTSAADSAVSPEPGGVQPAGQRRNVPEHFLVYGEEMAECRINGTDAGWSFWAPHIFDLTPYTVTGENVITLRFTGNAANLFTEHHIPFGLGVDNGDGSKLMTT